jgi:hypothetical protein
MGRTTIVENGGTLIIPMSGSVGILFAAQGSQLTAHTPTRARIAHAALTPVSFMYIGRSPALGVLREQLGQANRELLTVLVALEAVNASGFANGAAIRMAWADDAERQRAVRHARRFVYDAALARVVDVLDAYLGSLRRQDAFVAAMPALGVPERSIKARLETLVEALRLEITLEVALTHLAIQWRNRRLHSGSTNRLEQRYVGALRSGVEVLRRDYGGLDPHTLLRHFDSSRSPRLREVAAFSRGARALASQLDRAVVLATHPVAYATELLSASFRDGSDGAERLTSIWSTPPEKRRGKLAQQLRTLGFRDRPIVEGQTPLAEDWLEDLSRAGNREAAARFGLVEERERGRDQQMIEEEGR